MSYKIIYKKPQQKPVSNRIFRLQSMIALFLLLFAIGVRLCWPEGTEMIRSFVVTDELSGGAQMVASVVEQLENNGDFGDVVEAFCKELIHGE